jgi:hypothetical protein
MQKQKKRNFDKELSRVKLLVYDKGNNPLVFHSFLRDDRQGIDYTVTAMKERILKKYLNFKFNMAIFFDRQADKEISRFTTDDFNKSRIKLVVFDEKNRRRDHYSKLNEEDGNNDYTVGAMTFRVLASDYGNRFNAAIFYDARTGQEIRRMSSYGRIKAPIQEAV